MRPTHSDVIALARCLHAAPPEQRAGLCASAFDEAEAAFVYRQSSGQVHPHWGDGSLSGWAGQRDRIRTREPWLDDPDYAACLICVLEQIIARAGAQISSARTAA